MRPAAVIVGAMKAGTTSLFAYLAPHPEIAACRVKEPNFFDVGREGTWHRGLDWYESLFGPGDVTLEASTSLTRFPIHRGAPQRVASVMPHARIVYVVRDPVARMVSHYVHEYAEGFDRRTPEQALLYDSRYLHYSRYAMQLRQYLPHFSLDQILVVRTDDLAARPGAVVAEVLDHVGVDPSWEPDVTIQRNTAEDRRAETATSRRLRRVLERMPTPVQELRGLRRVGRRLTTRPIAASRPEIDDELRDALAEVLRPDVEELVRITGVDLTRS